MPIYDLEKEFGALSRKKRKAGDLTVKFQCRIGPDWDRFIDQLVQEGRDRKAWNNKADFGREALEKYMEKQAHELKGPFVSQWALVQAAIEATREDERREASIELIERTRERIQKLRAAGSGDIAIRALIAKQLEFVDQLDETDFWYRRTKEIFYAEFEKWLPKAKQLEEIK